MKKALAWIASFLIVASFLVPVEASLSVNSANTVIVLPTTKIVNGVPLHIGEDAISGSRLGAFLVLKGITEGTYTTTVTIPVEYHSVLIPDNNQTYYLNPRDMPDLDLNVSDQPVGHAVVVALNLSRVYFNETNAMATFLDRSVEIVFNENTTPLKVGGNYKIVTTKVNGRDVMYFYSTSNESNSTPVGSSLSVGNWTLRFDDVNQDANEMLIYLTYPSGTSKHKTMTKGYYYVMYVDSTGNQDFEEYSAYPSGRIDELLRSGAREVFLFHPTDFFVGIGGNLVILYDYDYYAKARTYADGDVYHGQWVWDIDPADKLFTLYLHVNSSDPKFPPVLVSAGESLSIPTDWNLEVQPVFKRDSNGAIIGVEGYRFVQVHPVTKTVSITAPRVVATDNVYDLIINDTQLTDLPSNKNVIIVGGWVSNKAWNVLEAIYGKSRIDAIKSRIETNGYVVEVLNNPKNPEYKVIILAGKTHVETRKAVDKFMSEI
ncbi:S-layer protein [Thermococcus sp.]|uniref:S-layer protein n=1 Tax=Thermococcus sp. TaxID=35749 RepID=UPI0026284600|nr:S-layer protein [Thermococcus sp.]